MYLCATSIFFAVFALNRVRLPPRLGFQNAQRFFSEVAFCTPLIFLTFVQVHAEEPTAFRNLPAYQEIWKKSQSLRPRPSIDTTPVVVKMGSNTYRIPRNYLTYMSIPTLKVTIPGYRIPGFLPLTEETRECFGSILQAQKEGCRSIEFRLFGPGLFTPREMLANLLSGLTNVRKKNGPFGYDLYEIGPDNARLEVYTKADGKNFIKSDCNIFDNNGKRDAVCTNIFVLNDGNTMHFFSYLDQLPKIQEIESGMRQLMGSFRLKETR